jgi:hypothetical protein
VKSTNFTHSHFQFVSCEPRFIFSCVLKTLKLVPLFCLDVSLFLFSILSVKTLKFKQKHSKAFQNPRKSLETSKRVSKHANYTTTFKLQCIAQYFVFLTCCTVEQLQKHKNFHFYPFCFSLSISCCFLIVEPKQKLSLMIFHIESCLFLSFLLATKKKSLNPTEATRSLHNSEGE